MIGKTEFKILFESSGKFTFVTICHRLTLQYISELHEILHATELFNIVLLLCMVKD